MNIMSKLSVYTYEIYNLGSIYNYYHVRKIKANLNYF